MPANVQRTTIFVFDASVQIEPQYLIYRLLQNGLREEYIVDDPNFRQGRGNIESHYQVKHHRKGTLTPQAPTSYTVTGNNARINISSSDSSINTVSKAGLDEELFGSIKAAIESAIESQHERSTLLRELETLQSTAGTFAFVGAYKNFISVAADHITIFLPFVPALSALLPHIN